jgi:dethiobiotin synthetase
VRVKAGIFISGTDTGVGKSVVSATLARLLAMRGVNVGVMKPATSGCRVENGAFISDDALLLCHAAGVPLEHDNAPYLLSEPLAPAEAAKIDGVELTFSHIIDCYQRLAARHDFMIVEGAGGLMVPLNQEKTVADLALELGLPLLVVARPNLGTINHTVLSCLVARQMGIDLAGVIINNYPEIPDLAEQSAAGYIRQHAQTEVICQLPHQEEPDDLQKVEQLAGLLNDSVAGNYLLEQLIGTNS